MDKRFFENWATQLRKGMLELGILNAIRGARLYGYDIVRKLRQVQGLMISEGTVYPILSRLKREALVETSVEESAQGPARKYYQLSPRGEQMLIAMNDHWQQIKTGTETLRRDPENVKNAPTQENLS